MLEMLGLGSGSCFVVQGQAQAPAQAQ